MYRIDKNIERRSRRLKNGRRGKGPVVYWVSRDQRANDNWALLYAQQEATIHQKGLLVVFCLDRQYPGATLPHFNFMLEGIVRMREILQGLNINFLLLDQLPPDGLPPLLRKIDAHLLVCDFDPLRIKRQWKEQLLKTVVTPIYEVDAHNIIPAWLVSEKKEYGAYTIRPKIKRLLDDYLTDIPELQHHPYDGSISGDVHRLTLPDMGRSFSPSTYPWESGEERAMSAAQAFITNGLQHYGKTRNNPCLHGQSGLSPYLHFGQLSAQRLALLVSLTENIEEQKEFLEELIVRRELADNFCYYEPDYDNFSGFPDWAKKSLDAHRNDKRDYLYSLEELEEGKTHEPLWNACQLDLVHNAKLHGYLRMYWAKKILEWTPDPETAMAYAIELNDRYSLDGRDPNGYTGIAWSIGGVHDRAWKDRSVFGKVRYMNEAGCRRKFDVAYYIESVRILTE